MGQEGLQHDPRNICGSGTDVGERGMAAGMKYTRERVWMRFRGTGTGSGETDIEVIGEYVGIMN